MRVSDLLDEGGVVLSPGWKGFDEAVRGLVDVLVARGRIPARLAEAAARAVGEREALASTAMVDIHVSVPHARVEGIEGVAAALAISAEGVYSVLADVPINIMVLVLSNERLAARHLNVLAKFATVLQSESFRARLLGAADEAEALAIVRIEERG